MSILLETAGVALLTAVAAIVRLHALERYPPGFQGDEAWVGLEAQRILAEGGIGVWSPTAWGQPSGPMYFTALLFVFLPDTVATVRLSTALIGVAGIPAFYLFARSFFGWRAAVIGAGLLTFSYWHVHYSRTAYPLIAAPLVVCIVLACLAHGVRSQRWWWFVAAGTAGGLGLYTYRGYALFLLPLAAGWPAVFTSRPYSQKALARHAALFSLACGLAAAPFLWFLVTQPAEYFTYREITSIFWSAEYRDTLPGNRPGLLWDQLWRAGSGYFVAREPDITDGLGRYGLLDPVTAALFVMGIALCLWRWRDWRSVMVLAGLMAGAVAVATTVVPGENRRGIAALPMVFAAAGLGGDLLLGGGARLLAARPRLRAAMGWAAPYAVLAWAIATAAVWNYRTYLHNLLPSDDIRVAYATELRDALEYVQALEGPKPFVYFYSDRWGWDYEARRFLAPKLLGEDRSRAFGEFALHRDPFRASTVFLLMPEYHEHLEELRIRYPHGEVHDVRAGEALVFTAFVVRGRIPPPKPPDEPMPIDDSAILSPDGAAAYNGGLPGGNQP